MSETDQARAERIVCELIHGNEADFRQHLPNRPDWQTYVKNVAAEFAAVRREAREQMTTLDVDVVYQRAVEAEREAILMDEYSTRLHSNRHHNAKTCAGCGYAAGQESVLDQIRARGQKEST